MEDILGHRRYRRDPRRLIRRSTVSVICVCLSHFVLYLISSFFASSNIITLLILPDVSFLLGNVFHVELIMLQIGIYRILSGDPGFVDCGPLSNTESYLELPTSDICDGSPSVQSSLLHQRVRYCKHCDAHVKGFDHHCPAFGNCIGQNNHLLFMALLAGFIIAEVCYIVGASQIATFGTLDSSGWTETLATSTMIFSLLQVLWQIHWKQYPEFHHIVAPQPGETVTATRFKNPYDKAIWRNLKEFIDAKG